MSVMLDRVISRGSRLGRIATLSLAVAATVLISTLGWVTPAHADNVTDTVLVGPAPWAIAVNPVTNKIYVANFDASNVSVIDGVTDTRVAVATGAKPSAVAVDPVTNKIYVANYGDGTVTIIDVAGNSTSTVSVGTHPVAVAVNPVTNKIYVVNQASNTVTVIDGATETTDTVGTGAEPWAVAVNASINKIYVANHGSNNVTVINGEDNSTVTVGAGTNPDAIAVDNVTDKVYVANFGSDTVTVITGSNNATATVSVGTDPYALAVNSVTNKIYVANNGSNDVTVIDGATYPCLTTTVSVGSSPRAIAANPATNKIYVANYGSNDVTIIDGVTETQTLSASNPNVIAVNPVTNRVYVGNELSETVTIIDGATFAAATVSGGGLPRAVATNPITNLAYVANNGSNDVTVINGVTNASVTVPAGSQPYAIAVNPVTNKIYVANNGSNDVTVIDGATYPCLTTTVSVGSGPRAVAVNPVTNKIYVANYDSNNVTIIDGATNATTKVTAGTSPGAIAVNVVTDKIYVANAGSANVTVIDGGSNATSTIAVGNNPTGLAVNPVTNKIYVANLGSDTVTIIDGATGATSIRASWGSPHTVAINTLTNKIYVANWNAGTVITIDGAAGDAVTSTMPVPTYPSALDVDEAHNKLYVVGYGDYRVAIVDGLTKNYSLVVSGTEPGAISVNPVTGTAYVTNNGGDSVSVITPGPQYSVPPTVYISGVTEGVADTRTPTFTFQLELTGCPFWGWQERVYYQIDTVKGPWFAAGFVAGEHYEATTAELAAGRHVLFVYASEGWSAMGTPSPGAVVAYPFTVVPPDSTPDTFTFTSQTGVALNTKVYSNAVDIAGINAAAKVHVSGGEYQIDFGGWTSADGDISPGQSIAVRHTSSGSYSTPVTTTLTVGGVAATFRSTTMAKPVPTVTKLGPASGSTVGGTTVTITGTNLTGATAVKFGGIAATAVNVVSSTSLTCTTPAHLGGTVDVTVTTSFGTSSTTGTSNDFTYAWAYYQENNTLLSYYTAWTTSASSTNYSGSYQKTRASAGGALTFTFKGTGFRVICTKGKVYGQMTVKIDGVAQPNVDLYAIVTSYKQTVLTASGLSNGTHTVILDYYSGNNANRSINLDAVAVNGTLLAACSRYQEDSSRLSYLYAWTAVSGGAYSGGYIRTRSSAGGVLTFLFRGTGFGIVCAKGPAYGKLKITIDGTPLTGYPDLYNATPLSKQLVYAKTGMTYGNHTVTIDCSGFKNILSSAKTVNLDALDIYGTLLQAP